MLVITVKSALGAYYVTTPESCPVSYQSQDCDYTIGEVVCGYSGGVTYCYDNASINAPTVNRATSTTNYACSDAACNGGFIIDCYSYDGSAPHCDNGNTGFCDRNSSCYNKHVQTTCFANLFTVSNCSTSCISGYVACDGSSTDPDGCEVQYGVTSCCTPDTRHNNIDSGCTCVCDTDYIDCDSGGVNATNGCEVHDGGSCSVGSLAGTYSSCTCVVDKSDFETGTKTEYQSTNPLLWGVHWGPLSGLGWLINLTTKNLTGADDDFTFGVNASGSIFGSQLGIGTTDPTVKLHVNDSGIVYQIIESSDSGVGLLLDAYTGGDANLIFKENGSNKWLLQYDGDGSKSPDSFFIYDDTANKVRFLINSSGDVGIGTTTPNRTLEVKTPYNAHESILRLSFDDSGTYYQGLDFYSARTGAEYAVAALEVSHGSSYINPIFRIQVADSSKALQTRMTIDKDGDVGIGVTNPAVELQVGAGAIATFTTTPDVATQISSTTNNDEVALQLVVNEGVQNRRAKFFVDDATGLVGIDMTATANTPSFVIQRVGSTKFIIDGDNEVGIGTTTPDSELQIYALNHPFISIEAEGGDAYEDMGGIQWDTTNGGGGTIASVNVLRGGSAFIQGDLIFNTSNDDDNQERMRIKYNGKVGIATIAPDSDLTIGSGTTTGGKSIHIEDHGDAYIWLEADEDNVGEDDNPYLKMTMDNMAVNMLIGGIGGSGVDPENNAYTGTLTNYYAILADYDSSGLQFGTNDNVRMTIEPGGHVGIGNTNPSEKLEVVGNIEMSGSNRVLKFDGGWGKIESNGGILYLNYDNDEQDINIGKNNVYIDASENTVGIGTTTPTRKLVVSGTGAYSSAASASIMLDNTVNDDDWYLHHIDTGPLQFWHAKGSKSMLTLYNDSAKVASFGDGNVYLTATGNGIHFRNRADTRIYEDNYRLMLDSPSGMIINLDSNNNEGDIFDIRDGATSRLYIDGNGHVGIADSTPDAFLDVEGLVHFGGATEKLMISDGGTDIQLVGYDGTGYNDIDIRAKAGAHLFLQTDGDVGIGTSNPLVPLHVEGQVRNYLAIGAADNVRGGLASYDTTAMGTGVGGQLVLGYKYSGSTYTEGAIVKMYKENAVSGQYGSGMKFQVRNHGENLATQMTIDPSGNVGIGTTAPLSRLAVGSAGNANYGISANTGGTYGVYGVGTNRGVMGAGGSYGVYGSGTSVGVLGFSGTAGSKGVYGTGIATGVEADGGTCDFDAVGSGTNYCTSSARRYKNESTFEDIPSALDKVNALRGIYFDWNTDHGGKHDMGMIAEEVGVIVPEVVAYEKNGSAHAIDYGALTPLLIEAIKEQDEKIAELESRLLIVEQMLNITSKTTTQQYTCEATSETRECPFGISGGKGTRCYKTEEHNTWNYCSSGWVMT